MTEAAKKILETFDSLPDTDRREVAVDILRRTVSSQHGLPEESELIAAADAVFLELDRHPLRSDFHSLRGLQHPPKNRVCEFSHSLAMEPAALLDS